MSDELYEFLKELFNEWVWDSEVNGKLRIDFSICNKDLSKITKENLIKELYAITGIKMMELYVRIGKDNVEMQKELLNFIYQH